MPKPTYPPRNGSELPYWGALKHKPQTRNNALFSVQVLFQDSTQRTICAAPQSPQSSHTDDHHPESAARETATRNETLLQLPCRPWNIIFITLEQSRARICSDTVCRWINGERILAGASTQFSRLQLRQKYCTAGAALTEEEPTKNSNRGLKVSAYELERECWSVRSSL